MRKALAAVLALPVLASVYFELLRRRPGVLRGPLAIASVGLLTLALTPVSGSGSDPDTALRLRDSSAARQVRPMDDRSADRVASLKPDSSEVRLAWPHDPERPTLEGLEAVATRPLDRPTIVRHRPFAGTTGLDPSALVSIRFSEAMRPRPTERALRISGLDPLEDGRLYWVEEGTVLVFDPADPLVHSRTYRVSLLGSATSRDGVAMSSEPTEIVLVYWFRVAAEVIPVRAPSVQEPARKPVEPSTSDSGWAWPLDGPITQYFGESRTKYGYHTGIDIDGTTGEPVRAARAGTVTVAGVHDDCSGLQVTIRHGDGLESWYRHLSGVSVRIGDEVARGAVVGRVGNTGCSLGSHLHFAIRRGSTWLDPLDFLPRR